MLESQEQFPYFLPDEVAIHNKTDDCWLTCLGGVYDLTDYVRQNCRSLISMYLVAHGGKDVSHWFEARGRRRGPVARLKRYVDPSTGDRRILLPYSTPIPEGTESIPTIQPDPEGCHCSCSCTSSCANSCSGRSIEIGDKKKQNIRPSWPTDCFEFLVVIDARLTGKSWLELEHIFNGSKYQIGCLTKKSRPCKITNVLTGQQATISVCEEDSIRRIRERAKILNLHGESYTWKFEGKPLDLALSLTGNGIADERDRYLACGLPDDSTTYVPNLLCYYNDDLTEL
ncbi:PREDICTED: cytochrome b5 domain-containing protein 1 [Ceratosolen solmsi marchali]|uniref:Cytochrome b5 domain-containing protein 1 n=1 Tax=Ceratosolen solmsi marchali TaxID=326594 RepID=A0AAJ7DYD1_9HYME|nr:PREDICTED: cytochrome b5 domain-containing protein 1 [Ceratosolen solmsi marchali]